MIRRLRRPPASLARAARDQSLADAVPYTSLAAPTVLRTRAGHYVQAFRLGGASFETSDDRTLNDWHERLNLLWRTLADENVALWSHLVRHTEASPSNPPGKGGFADRLAARYDANFEAAQLRTNDWYLSVVYRPEGPPIGRAGASTARATPAPHAARPIAADLAACARVADQLTSGLKRYEPEPLGLIATTRGPRSALLEFVSMLLNAETLPRGLPGLELPEAVATSRVIFGADALEYRLPHARRLAAFLAIKDYPSPTSTGMLNGLLRADYSFVLTQSFTFLPKSVAQGLLSRQLTRMQSARDLALSQAAALRAAMDQLAGNHFVLGDHHLTLQVMTEPEPLAAPTDMQCSRLEAAVAAARICLGDAGIVTAREDLAIEAAFRAQLPGNFADRPRRSPITSRNFAGFSPFHNYPRGRATGNHWGNALALLKTASGGPYHLSLHASDPAAPDGGSRRDTGHTFICGPTGSGKTVFLGFCVSQLSRQGVTQVLIDKDHGLEVLVNALGGEYRTLSTGSETGLNPLRLVPDHRNIEFLRGWLVQLAFTDPGHATARDHAEIGQALAGTLALPESARCLSRMLEFLDPTEPGSLHTRLSRWCRSAGGAYGWVFDNDDDRVVPLLASTALLGFDVTDFLRLRDVRSALASYLFHLIGSSIDGRRLVVWMDEFSTLLADPAFAAFSKDGLKTWRKQNAVAAFATQSPSDVLRSEIARTLIEQTPTKVFFPNPDADREEYTTGFGLSSREYELIRYTLAPGSRRFLLKQGHHSVVCELDLRGLDAELAVISGRAATSTRMRELKAAGLVDPEQWIPRLNQEEASS